MSENIKLFLIVFGISYLIISIIDRNDPIINILAIISALVYVFYSKIVVIIISSLLIFIFFLLSGDGTMRVRNLKGDSPKKMLPQSKNDY